MKKITFLFMLLAVTLGFSQSPTDNATPPPARDAGDVISIFSGEYTDVGGSDFNPNWGQAGFGTANTAFDPGTGDLVLAYPNFNYQGVQYGSAQNIAAMEFLHVDIWVNGTFNPNVFVISSGDEIAHSITNTAPQTWISVDIPVSGITGDTSATIQFKFDNGNGSTDAIYVDNLYFWRAAVDPMTDATLSDLQVDGSTISGFGPGTTDYTIQLPAGTTTVPQITSATTTNMNASTSISQASAIPGDATVIVTAENGTDMETYTVSMVAVGPSVAAPTPPNRAAADVISLYSDAYTDVASNFDAGWCGASSVVEEMVAGNAIQAYKNNACQGIVLDAGVDASTFTNLHVDIYIETGTDLTSSVFNLKFVQQPGGAALEINLNIASSPALVAGSWLSVDIPVDLSTFTGFKEFGITSNLNNLVWYDNLYVHKNTLSTEEFETTSFRAFPNPTNGDWNISGNSIINSIAIYDILGKQVIALAPNTNEAVIDASSLNSGIYFARIEGVSGSKTVKLIKE